MSCCPCAVTWRPRGASSPGRCAWARSRPRSRPTARPSSRGSSTSCPSALHTVEQYANNPIEADHGRLKARLRPMRGLKRHRSARTLAAGHAFVQNLRRGHDDIATDVPGSPQAREGLRRPSNHHMTSGDSSDHAPAGHRDGATQRCLLHQSGRWPSGWWAPGSGDRHRNQLACRQPGSRAAVRGRARGVCRPSLPARRSAACCPPRAACQPHEQAGLLSHRCEKRSS